MTHSRNQGRSAAEASPSKPSIFKSLFNRLSVSSRSGNNNELKRQEPPRYPSPRPQRSLQQNLPVIDLTFFFGPPCLNERHLWTIYEAETDACTVKVIRLATKPRNAKPRTGSCLKAPAPAPSTERPRSASPSPRPEATTYQSIPLQRVPTNSTAWTLDMSSPKPKATSGEARAKPKAPTGPARRATRAKENVEVSAIRRRRRKGSRDDLFSGCHL
ncbi:hypothetical protein DL96DRAFT_1710341 [Flagelloscypha sp. PMI_526]|nr:hypothetical protein DL96DRAFT_1710341 [Flagelloscypha sp. PMI_526]